MAAVRRKKREGNTPEKAGGADGGPGEVAPAPLAAPPKPRRRRLTQEEVEAQCQKILGLWAEGMGDAEARAELGLTKVEYQARVSRIAEDEWGNREGVWPRFLARALDRYREYQRVYRLAMEKARGGEGGDPRGREGEPATSPRPRGRSPKSPLAAALSLKMALTALDGMGSLERDIVEMGQRLGVYPRAAVPEGASQELAFRTLILETARRVKAARAVEVAAEVLPGHGGALAPGPGAEAQAEAGGEGGAPARG